MDQTFLSLKRFLFDFQDLNQDFLFNIQDIVLLVDIILNNEFIEAGDLDFNGVVNILDVIQLIDLILD